MNVFAKAAVDDEMANNEHASANNNGLAKAPIDKGDDLPEGFADKRKLSVKPGFKGKRAKKIWTLWEEGRRPEY